MFSDQRTPAGFGPESLVRNEWMLRGYELLDPAALNVSHKDLAYLATLTRKAIVADSLKKFPVLERYISANVTPIGDSVRPFAPYLIREVKAKRIGERPFKVGILGLTELPSGQVSPKSKIDIGGYTITDPKLAAAKYVPELREKVDIIVVLAYIDKGAASLIGTEVPGIDMIITAHQQPLVNRVDEAGDAVVAYATYETKFLGELRLYKSEGPKAGQIANYLHRNLALDTAVPEDKPSLKIMSDAKAAITSTVQASFK